MLLLWIYSSNSTKSSRPLLAAGEVGKFSVPYSNYVIMNSPTMIMAFTC